MQKGYLRLKMLKAEGEATLQKKAWLEVEQRAYEERTKLAEAKEGPAKVKADVEQGGSLDGSEEATEGKDQKVLELTATGGDTVADADEQAKKIHDLTAEGAARVAAREAMVSAKKVDRGGNTITF